MKNLHCFFFLKEASPFQWLNEEEQRKRESGGPVVALD